MEAEKKIPPATAIVPDRLQQQKMYLKIYTTFFCSRKTGLKVKSRQIIKQSFENNAFFKKMKITPFLPG